MDAPRRGTPCARVRGDAFVRGHADSSERRRSRWPVVNEISGPTADAYTGINFARNRAGIGNLLTGLTKEPFRDSVFTQRRLELAMEGPNGLTSGANVCYGSSPIFRSNNGQRMSRRSPAKPGSTFTPLMNEAR